MRLCCHCMSSHSFSLPLACLLSLLDPKPHHISDFPSFCQTPLDLHSLFSPPGDTSLFSLFMRLEANDQEMCGSAKPAPKELFFLFFFLSQVKGKLQFSLTLSIVIFALSFMSYSPKPHPVTLTKYMRAHWQCQQGCGFIINVGVF